MSAWMSRPTVLLLLSTVVSAKGSAEDRAGALRITLDQTACRAVDNIDVLRVTTRPVGSGGQVKDWQSVGQSAVTADCAWNLGAIAPGEYEVWFQQAYFKLAVRTLTIHPGEAAEVALTNDVVVTGVVLMNGIPFRGVAMEFSQRHGSDRMFAYAVPDTTGSYQVFLADDGPYTVVFQREKVVVLGQDQEGTAHRGFNRSDWLLEGGTLKVMPVGWDHKAPISLLIERKGPRTGRVFGVGVQADADQLPLTVIGLAFGTYEMRWMAEDLHPIQAPETATVNIDASNREPSLQLAVTGRQPR